MRSTQERVGILVVGAGFFGAQRAAAAARARGARLVGVHDRDGALARKLAQRHRAEAVPDFEAGVSRADVAVVIIATPHADHALQVRRALEAGKHVLCEKPLAIDPRDARELAQLAQARQLRLATGMNHRFYPPVRDALQLASAWAIGRVESVRIEIGHRASLEFLRSWRGDRARSGGGTLMDNGPHACDLIRKFLGEIVAAKGYIARGLDGPDGCETEAFALFRNSDRAIGELRSSWNLARGYLTIDVRGSGGFLHVETAPWRLSGVLSDGRRVEQRYGLDRLVERWHRHRFGAERSLVWEIEAFLTTPPHQPRQEATGWDGCRATEMVWAVYESAETGAEVALVPLPVTLPTLRKRVLERGDA
jgi:predicted dehydrogenase